MNKDDKVATDPVCGMKLSQQQIRESIVHNERPLYFCSAGCRAEFQRHPDEYVERAQSEENKRV